MLKKIDILGIEVDNYTVREAMMQVENYQFYLFYHLIREYTGKIFILKE